MYRKTMENLRNGIGVRLIINERDGLKWTSGSSYVSRKVFDTEID